MGVISQAGQADATQPRSPGRLGNRVGTHRQQSSREITPTSTPTPSPSLIKGEGSGLNLHAIVLAAGAASRFGGGKLTALHAGRPLLDAALAAAFAAPVGAVHLVHGADTAVPAAARAAAERLGRRQDLHLLHCAHPERGLSESLRTGLAALPSEAAGVFVFLGDMPAVPHAIAARLAARLDGHVQAVAPTCDGVRGHPVLLAAALFPVAMATDGDRGAGPLLAGLGDRLALVEVGDRGVLLDVDTPDDLAALGAAGPALAPRRGES